MTLKGNQNKLDANNDNVINKKDFEILRKKKIKKKVKKKIKWVINVQFVVAI